MENKMAHFAKLDENNIVLEVLVVDNKDIQNLPFPESEPIGVEYLTNIFPNTTWKQTSYNNNFRGHYAGIGYVYYPNFMDYGVFVSPKPFDNFIWDEATFSWVPPVPYPTDGHDYYWNVMRQQWSPIHATPPSTTIIG
jgi:hypothetical protein